MTDKETILVADDNPANVKLLAAFLDSRGYRIVSAGNGEEAIEKAKASDPAVILLDVAMPIMDGIEACARLKADPKTRHIPIIIVTALGDKATRLRCLKAGANEFLAKPMDSAELFLRVNNLAQLRKAEFLREHNELLMSNQAALEQKNRELADAYSELKKAQAQIIQQEKLALIGQIAAGVAHEINNPVAFITSNLGTMQKYLERIAEFIDIQTSALDALAPPDNSTLPRGPGTSAADAVRMRRKELKIDLLLEDGKQLLRECQDGTDRVKNIVLNLKGFSRTDETCAAMADINAGIESAINIVWNELKHKAEIKKEYGNLPLIRCNAGQLNQVFLNLLVNAAQAIETQGEITVRTWHQDGCIFASFQDTGCGISRENQARIFEAFFTTKEAGKGTGLGLSIASDLIRKHNGDISVQSEEGAGATFIVRLPVTGPEGHG